MALHKEPFGFPLARKSLAEPLKCTPVRYPHRFVKGSFEPTPPRVLAKKGVNFGIVGLSTDEFWNPESHAFKGRYRRFGGSMHGTEARSQELGMNSQVPTQPSDFEIQGRYPIGTLIQLPANGVSV
jgi:hypothetical protein